MLAGATSSARARSDTESTSPLRHPNRRLSSAGRRRIRMVDRAIDFRRGLWQGRSWRTVETSCTSGFSQRRYVRRGMALPLLLAIAGVWAWAAAPARATTGVHLHRRRADLHRPRGRVSPARRRDRRQRWGQRTRRWQSRAGDGGPWGECRRDALRRGGRQRPHRRPGRWPRGLQRWRGRRQRRSWGRRWRRRHSHFAACLGPLARGSPDRRRRGRRQRREWRNRDRWRRR